MRRFLRKAIWYIINRRIILGAIVAAVLLLLQQYAISAAVVVIIILSKVIERFNAKTRYKIEQQKTPFLSTSKVRNLEYLIIGDICKAEDMIPHGKSYYQISVPGCGLYQAYELLRHCSSILKEEASDVVFAISKEGNNEMTVFVFPFLSYETIKKQNLDHLKARSKYPVLYHPIGCVKFMLGSSKKGWQQKECPAKEITEFCTERNINLHYFTA